MKRSALRRKTPLNPKRSKPRRTEQVRDREYLDAVKRHGECCAVDLANAGRCWGPIDPHHTQRGGAGLKGSDHAVIPLCRKHHGNIEDLSGPFKGWNRARRDSWTAEKVLDTRARVSARQRIAKHLARIPEAA